jgi:hypothetical protein
MSSRLTTLMGRSIHARKEWTLTCAGISKHHAGMASAIPMSPAALVRLIALPLNRRFAIHTLEGPEIQPASAK